MTQSVTCQNQPIAQLVTQLPGHSLNPQSSDADCSSFSVFLLTLVQLNSRSEICLNPFASKNVYIQFQANFRLNKIILKFVKYLVVDAQVIK